MEESGVVILHFYFTYLYSVVDFTFYDLATHGLVVSIPAGLYTIKQKKTKGKILLSIRNVTF